MKILPENISVDKEERNKFCNASTSVTARSQELFGFCNTAGWDIFPQFR